ncbi:MAG: beta strand repeat-containing protein, partial [Bacteroidota bacterium]
FSISGKISIQGSAVGITTAPTFGASSTLEYKNVSTRTTNAIEWPSSNGPSNLIIDNSGSTVTMLASNNRTLTGDLTLTAGTLADNGNTLTVQGNIAGTGTHSGAGSITMSGATSSKSISGATLGNLTLNDADGFSLSGSPTINGNLVLTAGTLTLGANTLTYNGSSITRTSGNIDASNGSATLAFTKSSAVSLPASLFSGNVNNLTINGSGGLTLGSSTTVAGTLALTSGTLTTGANTFTYFGSSITRSSGNINASNTSGGVTFTNTSGLTLPSSLFTGTVNALTINGSGGITLGSGLTLTTLNLSSGTFTVGSSNTVSVSSGGSVNRTSGTLASGTDGGKFSFSGTGTVSGTVGFNNVDIAGGVDFGTASTINGTLTINSGGFVSNNKPPIYGTSSKLYYFTTGNYGRGA